MDVVSNNTKVGCALAQCSIGIRSVNKISPTPLQLIQWQHSMMLLSYGWYGFPTIHMLQQKSRLIRPRNIFGNLLLLNFDDPLQILTLVSCFELTELATGVVFCCCCPCASRFNGLGIQRRSSAYLGFKSSTGNHLPISQNQSDL